MCKFLVSFLLTAVGCSSGIVLADEVAPRSGPPKPAAPLQVTVGPTRVIKRAANYPVMVKFADASVIVDSAMDGGAFGAVRSADGGNTWKDWPGGLKTGADGSRCVLADGTALAFEQRTNLVQGQPNKYQGKVWISTDHGKSFVGPSPTRIEMPYVTEGIGDGGPADKIDAPVFHGRSFAVKDDSLLATMYTKFVADAKIQTSSPYRFRCVLVRSADRGKNWQYVSTIASLAQIKDPNQLNTWQDGFDEPSLEVLPSGKLVCAMRTGTYSDEKVVETYHDLAVTTVVDGKYRVTKGEPTRPIYLAASTDGGKTWGSPRPVPGARGACPRLLLLSNGVLALSYGRVFRPTQRDGIVFSTDGGETWTNPTEIFPGLSSGYTDMVETAPGKILYVFDSVTAWGPKYGPDWIGAVDIDVKTAKP
jgi:hypothetical protein